MFVVLNTEIEMKLSIVIPVYNMEKYVERCLDSITSQSTFAPNEYEVIVVNDGSTDSSQQILDSYDWKGINHLIIAKSNGGLSDARNVGFIYVKGDYTWFVDSDDWIEKNCLNSIFQLLKGEDVLHFTSYYRDYDHGMSVVKFKTAADNGPNLVKGRFLFPVQFSIYKTSFLKENNLSFHFNIVMEDLHFTPRALYKAKSVVVSSIPVYHYYQREGSIMKSKVNTKRIQDRIWISHDLYAFMINHVCKEDQREWSECIITDINAIMFDACRSGENEHLHLVRKYINGEKHLTHLLKYSDNFKNQIWYYLGKFLGGDFYSAYSILYKLRY